HGPCPPHAGGDGPVGGAGGPPRRLPRPRLLRTRVPPRQRHHAAALAPGRPRLTPLVHTPRSRRSKALIPAARTTRVSAASASTPPASTPRVSGSPPRYQANGLIVSSQAAPSTIGASASAM